MYLKVQPNESEPVTLQSIIDSLENIVYAQIQRDIQATKDCACGVNLDPATKASISCLVSLSQINLTEKKSHPRKGVAQLTDSTYCVLISLAGVVAQIISAYIIGRRVGRKAAKDAFKAWIDARN